MYHLSDDSADFLRTLKHTESGDIAESAKREPVISRLTPVIITADWSKKDGHWIAKARRLWWTPTNGYKTVAWNPDELEIFCPTADPADSPPYPSGDRAWAVFRGRWEIIGGGGGGASDPTIVYCETTSWDCDPEKGRELLKYSLVVIDQKHGFESDLQETLPDSWPPWSNGRLAGQTCRTPCPESYDGRDTAMDDSDNLEDFFLAGTDVTEDQAVRIATLFRTGGGVRIGVTLEKAVEPGQIIPVREITGWSNVQFQRYEVLVRMLLESSVYNPGGYGSNYINALPMRIPKGKDNTARCTHSGAVLAVLAGNIRLITCTPVYRDESYPPNEYIVRIIAVGNTPGISSRYAEPLPNIPLLTNPKNYSSGLVVTELRYGATSLVTSDILPVRSDPTDSAGVKFLPIIIGNSADAMENEHIVHACGLSEIIQNIGFSIEYGVHLQLSLREICAKYSRHRVYHDKLEIQGLMITNDTGPAKYKVLVPYRISEIEDSNGDKIWQNEVYAFDE